MKKNAKSKKNKAITIVITANKSVLKCRANRIKKDNSVADEKKHTKSLGGSAKLAQKSLTLLSEIVKIIMSY